MSNVVTSSNMRLTIPVQGVESGPQYALDINSCLLTIDGHDHSAGNGVQITPSGLDINTDLAINANNLTGIRSVRLNIQSAVLTLPADLNCLYDVSGDLYFNDGAGNNVRITQSGGVAGSPGSISNLTSPASASYVALNQTFVWQSAANTPANMDNGSVILRNIVANSKGLSLNPPAAMAADYSLTLPNIPDVQRYLTIDTSGNISAYSAIAQGITGSNIANTTITATQIALQTITANRIADNTITATQIASNANIAGSQLADVNQQVSSSCGSFSTNSITPVAVTNLSITITTTGKPIFIGLIPDGTTSQNLVSAQNSINGTSATMLIEILVGATIIATYPVSAFDNGGNFKNIALPCSVVNLIYSTSSSTITISVNALVTSNSTTGEISNCKLYAYELK